MLLIRLLLAVAVPVAGAVLAGCRHARTAATSGGTSGFRFLNEDTPPPVGHAEAATELVPVDVLVPAEPLGTLAPPRYPKLALGQVVVPATYRLRLTINPDGRVADFEPSQLGVRVPGQFDADFRAAIATAVARWHFLPAERRHLVPAKRDGRQIWLVTRTEKAESSLDVEFTFSASGSVVSSLPK